MFTWNTCNNKTILQELEVMNSNPEYNRISEDKAYLTEADILKEHEDEIEKERYIVTSESSPIAIVDFTMSNPRDKNPWLGLFIIHKNAQNKGYAKTIYSEYEKLMIKRQVKEVHLGCLVNNEPGIRFWEKTGYSVYEEIDFRGKPLYCLKKTL
ncbi:GNAT family N-acetyltransferase [Bacillus sp. V59.32b]|uniref:GNAT family N-acetyltransferase n=1 Tax=Bacillus sp. V59.32b TaxID=1758642 RepID=UPI000E3DD83B|nr:GNAT family N-acetyltransferase [Bacillus sp. V59.32b]RFU67618.1 GNAT family N-acetyltransferase [Bacillus sp. V59.32b]